MSLSSSVSPHLPDGLSPLCLFFLFKHSVMWQFFVEWLPFSASVIHPRFVKAALIVALLDRSTLTAVSCSAPPGWLSFSPWPRLFLFAYNGLMIRSTKMLIWYLKFFPPLVSLFLWSIKNVFFLLLVLNPPHSSKLQSDCYCIGLIFFVTQFISSC